MSAFRGGSKEQNIDRNVHRKDAYIGSRWGTLTLTLTRPFPVHSDDDDGYTIRYVQYTLLDEGESFVFIVLGIEPRDLHAATELPAAQGCM